MSPWWMMTAAAACISLLLTACVPELSNDTGLYFGHGGEGESNSECQMMEVFINGTVPRYTGTAEDVVVEARGMLGVGAEPYVWSYGLTSNGFDIRLTRYYIPLTDLDDLCQVITDGAQRYRYGYTTEPVPRDEDKGRSVVLGDQDGNLLSSYYLENNAISVFFGSGYLSALQPDGMSQCLRFSEPEELLPRVTTVDAYDANKQGSPLIFRRVTTDSDKKSRSRQS